MGKWFVFGGDGVKVRWTEEAKDMSIGEPPIGVYMIFLIFFSGSMNSYESVFVFFCIGEPVERVHKNKIIIFLKKFQNIQNTWIKY